MPSFFYWKRYSSSAILNKNFVMEKRKMTSTKASCREKKCKEQRPGAERKDKLQR
jgi:hypothetical protein